MTTFDRQDILDAYEDVRSDSSETSWVVYKYEGNQIVVSGTGTDYEEFREHFTEDDRGFGYVRMIGGDELSKRAKFVLITWVGSNVSGIKRGTISTDKSLMKSIIVNYAVEMQPNELNELEESFVMEQIAKAGGANYGTGS